jgi:hypothetical protein
MNDQDGSTALHFASSRSHLPVVELLVKISQDRNVANKVRFSLCGAKGVICGLRLTFLVVCEHKISRKLEKRLFIAHVKDTELKSPALLELGADHHAKNNVRWPQRPMLSHFHLDSYHRLIILWLFFVPCVVSENNHEPLHSWIQLDRYGRGFNPKTPETLQVLVSFGATWNAKCDELVSSGMAKEEAPALQICMLLWSQELADDLPFTPIPIRSPSADALGSPPSPPAPPCAWAFVLFPLRGCLGPCRKMKMVQVTFASHSNNMHVHWMLELTLVECCTSKYYYSIGDLQKQPQAT